MNETPTLYAMYAVQMVGTAFLAILLWRFYRTYRHSYLREWSLSWAALWVYVSGGLLALLWTRGFHPQHPVRLIVAAVTLIAGYTQIVFLLFGTYAAANGRPVAERSRNAILLGCVLFAIALVFPYTSEPAMFAERFYLRLALRSAAAGAAYIFAGLWLARNVGWRTGSGRAVVIGSFLLYGLSQMTFFVTGSLEVLGYPGVGELSNYLGFVDFLLQFSMGIGMAIWLLEDERNELSRTAEALQRSEERLRQSQRLETVGQLAGGVAHDFNNLLTVITGRGQRLLERLDTSSEDWRDVRQIDEAAARGASLVRQLLAFSRRQVLAPRDVDVNKSVRDVQDMLQRLIGEEISFQVDLADDLGWTRVDPVQLEQVLVNLVVNARDAMPAGGTLTVSTRNSEVLAEDSDSLMGLLPGRHVEITVRDTGVGMDASTRRHVFEPFFTTKEVGEGTGLGLATVYGVVRQSGGTVTIDSSPGEGTAVHVHLPRVSQPEPTAEPESASAAEPRPLTQDTARATVLVVEDDERIRGLLTAVLQDNGYDALIAEDGVTALDIVDANGHQIDLLLTDIVMPKIGGPELADRLQERYPDLRVVFMSGYAEETLSARFDRGDRALLEKPFSLPDLLACVSSSLNG